MIRRAATEEEQEEVLTVAPSEPGTAGTGTVITVFFGRFDTQQKNKTKKNQADVVNKKNVVVCKQFLVG